MTTIHKSNTETKFRNKYRIQSTRLKNYNYSQNGAYFITICTKNREHWFGKIVNSKRQLSKIGKQVETCWFDIPHHFPFVKLGEFVVMPNHIHGIIIIDKINVETQNFASLRQRKQQNIDKYQNKFGQQSQNLASVIRGFKIGVTKYTRQNTDTYTF